MVGIQIQARRFLSISRQSLASKNASSISVLKAIVGVERQIQTEEKVNIDSKLARRFSEDEIYEPFNLSMTDYRLKLKNVREQYKVVEPFSRNSGAKASNVAEKSKKNDIFKNANIDPINLYTFTPILTQYVSEFGKIYHSDAHPNLSKKSYKRLCKAIRRARAMGLMSPVSNVNLESFTRRM